MIERNRELRRATSTFPQNIFAFLGLTGEKARAKANKMLAFSTCQTPKDIISQCEHRKKCGDHHREIYRSSNCVHASSTINEGKRWTVFQNSAIVISWDRTRKMDQPSCPLNHKATTIPYNSVPVHRIPVPKRTRGYRQ